MSNLLYMSLTLTRGRIERDVAKIEALQRNPEGAGWFDSVILKVPSWQEFRRAMNMPVTRYAMEVLEDLRLPFYWTRNLWISHPNNVPDGIPLTGPESHLQPEYYAAAIGRLRAEEERVEAYYGCIGCGFDVECYGKDGNPQTDSLAGRKWDHRMERDRLRAVIQQAVDVTGPVDLAMPYGHRTRIGSYSWCFGPLAWLHISEMPTYPALRPKDVVVNAPPEHPFEPAIRGIQVGREDGRFPKLTEDDVKAVDSAAWAAAYPSLDGAMVYIDHDQWPAVIGGWSA